MRRAAGASRRVERRRISLGSRSQAVGMSGRTGAHRAAGPSIIPTSNPILTRSPPSHGGCCTFGITDGHEWPLPGRRLVGLSPVGVAAAEVDPALCSSASSRLGPLSRASSAHTKGDTVSELVTPTMIRGVTGARPPSADPGDPRRVINTRGATRASGLRDATTHWPYAGVDNHAPAGRRAGVNSRPVRSCGGSLCRGRRAPSR